MKVHCPRCEALVIQGVPCHETGCPNQHQKWVVKGGKKRGLIVPKNEDLPKWWSAK